MKRLLLLPLFAATVALAQKAETLPADLTLRQALEIALMNNNTLRTAEANLERASGKYEQARSALLPELDAVARQAYLTVNLQGIGIDLPSPSRVEGPFGSMDARGVFSQDLLNIANLRSFQSFSSHRDSSRFLAQDAREAVTLNVVGAYLQALRAKANRETITEQTKLATDLYQITTDRLKRGVASDLDANRAKQKVNSLEQNRQEAEQSYVAAKLTLAGLLEANVTSDFEVSDPAAYGSGGAVDKGVSLQAAFAARADYRAAEAAVRAAEYEVKSIEATRLPTLTLRASDGQSGTYPDHNVNTYSVAGLLTFPIFTSGRIGGQIREAQAALEEATAALDKNRAQIEVEVLTALSGVEWAMKQVETSSENLGLSRQEVDLSRVRFVQGVADNTEVVNAQDRLTQADDASIRAQYTLGLARANLARAMGGAERAYRK